MIENTEKFNLEQIVNMVTENPNDFDLGSAVRQYVKSNVKPAKYSNVTTDPNQLSFDFGNDSDSGSGYVDVDESEIIDLGDTASNLSVGN